MRNLLRLDRIAPNEPTKLFRLRFLICPLLIMVWVSHALGTTYYVGTIPSASDNNPGTSESLPLRTIGKAALKVNPGDTVVILSGDYRNENTGWGIGVIPITRSGSATQPISFVAREGAIIDRVLCQRVSHVSLEGFKLQTSRFTQLGAWQDMPAIVRNLPRSRLRGVDFLGPWAARQAIIEQAFASYFSLVKSLEYHIAIDLVECQSIKVTRNTIDGYWAGIQTRGSSSVDLSNNNISHTVIGIFCRGLTKGTIRNNTVKQTLDIGIDVRENSSEVLVESNRVSYSGISHISFFSGTTRSTIRRNSVSWGGYYSESMKFPGSSAINLNGAGVNNLVELNFASNQIDFTEVDGNGIIIDLMPQNSRTVIRYNFANYNMGSGLNTTASPGCMIYGNTFMGNGVGGRERRNGAGIKLSRDEDVRQTIMLNLFMNNRSAGILSYRVLNKQSFIDFNSYITLSAPVMWDGFLDDENLYPRIEDVRARTGWELRGIAVGPFVFR